jgi:hypothetical protein
MYIIGSILIYYHVLLNFFCFEDSNKLCYNLKYPGETYKVRLYLPKGERKLWGITVQKGHRFTDCEYRISFGDDSFIYIWGAKSFSSPNIDNIKCIRSEEAQIRVSNDCALTSDTPKDSVFIYPDGRVSLIPSTQMAPAPFSMVFYGIDENGLAWKDIKIGRIAIGYQNVQECDILKFESILNTIHIKHICNHIKKRILINDYL